MFVYFLYCFVVYGCSDVIEGNVHARGEKVEACADLSRKSLWEANHVCGLS